jgi:diguanylate cyclase (GGDEF)-like protein/PAS domain S-box-containing protein
MNPPVRLFSVLHRSPRWSRLVGHPVTAWGVLAVSLVMAILAWRVSVNAAELRDRQIFLHDADISATLIQQRMERYEQLLHAAATALGRTSHPTREQWISIHRSLDPSTRFPGLQGLGYAAVLPQGEHRATFERAIRHQPGFENFSITPKGEREPASAILHLEPYDWRNQRAFGFDMLSEPVRAEAMERARDSGNVTLSGRVTLVQEISTDVQSGTLMYRPVFRKGWPVSTPEERRAALMGYVYSPFRMNDLMHSVLGPKSNSIAFEIFDGATERERTLLYSSVPKDRDPTPSRFGQQVNLNVGGRSWLLRFRSTPQFDRETYSALPDLIGLGALITDAMLFVILALLGFNERLLSNRTELLTSVFEHAPLAIVMINSDGAIVRVNRVVTELLGYTAAELIGKPVEALIDEPLRTLHQRRRQSYLQHPTTRAMGSGLDLHARHRDGRLIPVEIGLSPIQVGRVSFVLASVMDLSNRKAIEQERAAMAETLREMAYHDPLTGLYNRRALSEQLESLLERLDQAGDMRLGGLLFIDMDHFKDINDTLGHDVGDLLLKDVAHRLKTCVRESDIVARLGGDEFVVMVQPLGASAPVASEQLHRLAAQLLEALDAPYVLGTHHCVSTPSIGGTLFGRDDQVGAIFKRADDAMYEVKKNGRNSFRCHEPSATTY